jgi:serine-threonine kinase receptor-associated protein
VQNNFDMNETNNTQETIIIGKGHSRPVVNVTCSNLIDDSFWFEISRKLKKRILSSSKDNTILLRNGETGDWVGTFSGHKGAICSATFDKTSTRVCSASSDFTV